MNKIANLVYIDLETTGLQNEDVIVEIAMIDECKDIYKTYCNTNGREFSDGALQVTKFTRAELLAIKRADDFSDVAMDIWKYLFEDAEGNAREPIIVAHNASFEKRMLISNYKLLGSKKYDLDKLEKLEMICTLKLSRDLIPEIKSHKLDNVSRHLGLFRSERTEKGHRALIDTEMAHEIYNELISKLPAHKFTNLHLIQKKPKKDRCKWFTSIN